MGEYDKEHHVKLVVDEYPHGIEQEQSLIQHISSDSSLLFAMRWRLR
jgi:hypothetical protein